MFLDKDVELYEKFLQNHFPLSHEEKQLKRSKANSIADDDADAQRARSVDDKAHLEFAENQEIREILDDLLIQVEQLQISDSN